MLATVLTFFSTTAQEPRVSVTQKALDSLAKGYIEGTEAIVRAETYRKEVLALKQEVEALKTEVARKEGVIVAQIEKNKVCYRQAENYAAQIGNLDLIVKNQDEAIRKLSKPPKRFGIGLQTGYSLTGYYLGVGVSLNIIRW